MRLLGWDFMRKRVVALVSGGVESLCLVVRLLQRAYHVAPVYVRCGLRWESAEQWWLRKWLQAIRHPRLRPLVVLDLPVASLYGHHWSLTGRSVPSRRTRDEAVYLPGRNLLLLSAAAIYAARQGVSRLALGTLVGNPFGDATPRFFHQAGDCVRQALDRPIQIATPLRHFTKTRLIAAMGDQPFRLTFSCLQPRGRRHCGDCNKCAERRRAFRLAGVADPTPYAVRSQ